MFGFFDYRRPILITACILASLIIIVSLYCTVKRYTYSRDRPTDPSRIVIVRPEAIQPVYVLSPLPSMDAAVQPVTYPQPTAIIVDQAPAPTLTNHPYQYCVPIPASSSSPAQYPPMPCPSRSPMPTTYPSTTQVPPISYPLVISSQATTTTDSTPPAYTSSTIQRD